MKYLEKLFIWIGGAAVIGTVILALLAFVLTVANLFSGSGTPEPKLAESTETQAEPAAEAPAATPAAAPAAAVAAAAPAGGHPAITAEAGEKVFRKCKACHSFDKGGRNGTGPNLYGVVGNNLAAAEGFKYSDAFQAASDQTWTPERLDAYLADPKGDIPGNRMAFAGLRKEEDRQNVIAFLASHSDTPLTPADLGFATAAAATTAAAPAAEAAAAEEVAEVELEEIPYPEGVTYRDPEPRTAEEQAAVDARVAALQAEVDAGIDYERARFHPIHFPPAIAEASNEECLVCHQEVLEHTPRDASPAGVPATDTIAWYQTLDTYWQEQASFHWRHMESDFSKMVMNLECNFCHQGNDPREESPDMIPTRAEFTAPEMPEFNLRKMVNPETTCLLCHGQMPDPVEIMALGGDWHEVRGDMEYPEAPNGCLSCHADLYRTVRHNVDYLKAASIEEVGRAGSSDTCYGCHGGRAWYRISYPYPRHDWPGMFDDEMPAWAEGRPTESNAAHRLPQPQTAAD